MLSQTQTGQQGGGVIYVVINYKCCHGKYIKLLYLQMVRRKNPVTISLIVTFLSNKKEKLSYLKTDEKKK